MGFATLHPSYELVGPLAKALNVSTDELLELKQTKETLSPNLASLWRMLKVIENFSDKEKKSVLQYGTMGDTMGDVAALLP